VNAEKRRNEQKKDERRSETKKRCVTWRATEGEKKGGGEISAMKKEKQTN
jgi:hypothetical protein